MELYLVWNIKNNAWRMGGFVGFTDEAEFAGLFDKEWLERNTGIYDTRTGDYANNLLIGASSVEVKDFRERIKSLSKPQKKELKKAIMIEKKRRGLPVELIIKDDKRCCPYCRKELVQVKRVLDKTYCGKCGNPFTEIEEW